MNPATSDERTPQGFAKVIFGTPQPCAIINQVHIRNELVQLGYEIIFDPAFVVVPPFHDEAPEPGALAFIFYYHDAGGNPIMDANFDPIINPVPANAFAPVPAGAPAGAPGVALPPRLLSARDIDSIYKLRTATHKINKAKAEKYQTIFDAFKSVLNKYLSPQAIRELETPLNARDIKATWELITTKITQGNRLVVATIVERYAFVYDWGIRETLTQCLQRHEILWQHMENLSDPPSDIRKKSFLIQMIEAATGTHGPYLLQLAEASAEIVNYDGAKKLFIAQEPAVIARSGCNSNKAGANNTRQVCTDLWIPYDGKKKKVGNEMVWTYDKETEQGYMDPHTLSASTALATTHVATVVQSGDKTGQSKGGRKPRSPCPICGEKHFIRECKKAYKCTNASCTNWYHKKGTNCDGGKAKREHAKKIEQSKKAKSASAAAVSEDGPPSTNPPPAIADVSSTAAALVAQQSMVTQQLVEQLRRQQRQIKSLQREVQVQSRSVPDESDEDDDWEDM
jgi:hypothetical protein